MKLKDFIEKELTKDGSEEKTALWTVLKNIIIDCKNHLSQITTQLSDFDIHPKLFYELGVYSTQITPVFHSIRSTFPVV